MGAGVKKPARGGLVKTVAWLLYFVGGALGAAGAWDAGGEVGGATDRPASNAEMVEPTMLRLDAWVPKYAAKAMPTTERMVVIDVIQSVCFRLPALSAAATARSASRVIARSLPLT